MSLLQHNTYTPGFNPTIVGELPGVSLEQARQGQELAATGYYLSALATPSGIRVHTFLHNEISVSGRNITVVDGVRFGLEYGDQEAIAAQYSRSPIRHGRRGSFVLGAANRVDHLIRAPQPVQVTGTTGRIDHFVTRARTAHAVVATLAEAAGCANVDAHDILIAYGQGLSSLHSVMPRGVR